jgi:GGDEF domain-containing protein
VVALVGDNAFAVLLVDVDRRTAFEISKRLRNEASQPVDVEGEAVEVSISVGLSHDVGLVDPVELFASAESAMEDAQDAGGARMLVAC